MTLFVFKRYFSAARFNFLILVAGKDCVYTTPVHARIPLYFLLMSFGSAFIVFTALRAYPNIHQIRIMFSFFDFYDVLVHKEHFVLWNSTHYNHCYSAHFLNRRYLALLIHNVLHLHELYMLFLVAAAMNNMALWKLPQSYPLNLICIFCDSATACTISA